MNLSVSKTKIILCILILLFTFSLISVKLSDFIKKKIIHIL